MFRVLRAIVTVKKPPTFFIYGIIVIHFGPGTGLAPVIQIVKSKGMCT